MDRTEIERLLEQVEGEKNDVQSRLATLQAQSNALVKAAEGLRALLDMTPEHARLPVSFDLRPGPAAEETATREDEQSASAVRGRAEKPPKGKRAVKLIIESDQSRFWNVREVWDEQVRRRWEQPRPRGAKGILPPASRYNACKRTTRRTWRSSLRRSWRTSGPPSLPRASMAPGRLIPRRHEHEEVSRPPACRFQS